MTRSAVWLLGELAEMCPDCVRMLAGSGQTVHAALTFWDRWPRKCSLVMIRMRFTYSNRQWHWQMVPGTFIGWFLLGAHLLGIAWEVEKAEEVTLKVVEQRRFIASLRQPCKGLFCLLALATRKPRGKLVAKTWITVYSPLTCKSKDSPLISPF